MRFDAVKIIPSQSKSWVIDDSGASQHMTDQRSELVSFTAESAASTRTCTGMA